MKIKIIFFASLLCGCAYYAFFYEKSEKIINDINLIDSSSDEVVEIEIGDEINESYKINNSIEVRDNFRKTDENKVDNDTSEQTFKINLEDEGLDNISKTEAMSEIITHFPHLEEPINQYLEKVREQKNQIDEIKEIMVKRNDSFKSGDNVEWLDEQIERKREAALAQAELLGKEAMSINEQIRSAARDFINNR